MKSIIETMATHLLLGIKALLQYLQQAIDSNCKDSDILVICEYLRNHTKDSSLLLSLATIVKVRHILVHEETLDQEDWLKLSRALLLLESWYRDAKRIHNPFDTTPETITFMTMNHWVMREAVSLQKLPENSSLVVTKEVENPYKHEDYLMVATLKELKDSGWRKKLHNYEFRILDGKHEGEVASLKGWNGTVCHVNLRGMNGTKIPMGISIRRKIGLMNEKYKTRGYRHYIKMRDLEINVRGTLEDFGKYRPRKDMLDKIIAIFNGNYTSKEGKIVKFDGKFAYVKVLGEKTHLLIGPQTQIGFYEPPIQEDNSPKANNFNVNAPIFTPSH